MNLNFSGIRLPARERPSVRAIFAIGALISAIWLGAAASYVQFRITWQSLLDLPFVDLAAFVAAAFGPPAALWLIIGYVQLGSALRENNFALKQLHWQTKRAADQAEVEQTKDCPALMFLQWHPALRDDLESLRRCP